MMEEVVILLFFLFGVNGIRKYGYSRLREFEAKGVRHYGGLDVSVKSF